MHSLRMCKCDFWKTQKHFCTFSEHRRGGRPIGVLSLNVSGIGGADAKNVVNALQELLSSIYPLVKMCFLKGKL